MGPRTSLTRLLCHYCSHHSMSSKVEGNRFECEKCGSLNEYDQDGQIVDIHPVEGEIPIQYTTPVHFQENDIFCSICQKNQYLYMTMLSEFLPDPDDPNYSQLEAAIPEFKESLEERYPQCCARCAPKAKAQLEHVTYQARSDHVRRMLEKSRKQRLGDSFRWKSLIITGTGLLHFMSLLVQLLWHTMGLATRDGPAHTLAECIPGGKVPLGCATLIEPYVGWSILFGLLSGWWNPQWWRKVQGQEGKLHGLGRYYQLQLMLLATRFTAWIWCADFAQTKSLEILHTVFLVSILGLSLCAILAVEFHSAPLKINWDYRPPDLVSANQFAPPSPPDKSRFDIMSLAQTTRPDLKPWRPVQPVETDEMDWQPSQSFDAPKQVRFRNTLSSPFHGALPTVQGPAKHQVKQAIGIPPGHFDKKDILPANKDGSVAMAEPKFFQRSNDTGLEDIFDQVFSLHEFPSKKDMIPMSTAHSDQPPAATPGPEPSALNYSPFVLGILMLIGLLLWSMAGIIEIAMPNLRLYAIAMMLGRCMLRFGLSRVFTTQIILSVEMLALLGLGVQLLKANPALHTIYIKIGSGLFVTLSVQELVFYLQGWSVGA